MNFAVTENIQNLKKKALSFIYNYSDRELLSAILAYFSKTKIPNIKYAYSWRYLAGQLDICENNIGNERNHKK